MLDNPVYTGRIAFGRTKMERIDGTENEYRRVKSDDYIMSDEVVHEPIISDELFEATRKKGRRQRQQVILELEGMQSICYLVF